VRNREARTVAHPQNIDIIDTRLRALDLRMSTE
jgi:hypothetical protein